jgi:amino acid transporter
MLPRQAISIPAMIFLSVIILKKGANMGKGIICGWSNFIRQPCFFFLARQFHPAKKVYQISVSAIRDDFFFVFAIVFPAFTGMTAGVGLSGDLRNPGNQYHLVPLAATIIGMIIYILVSWKLAVSASQYDLD